MRITFVIKRKRFNFFIKAIMLWNEIGSKLKIIDGNTFDNFSNYILL